MTKPFDPFNQCTEYARQIQELLAANAALELEVVRLRNALEHLSKAAGQTIDVRTPEDWVNLNIGLSLSIQVMSTPFTPTALPELIEKGI